MFEPRSERNVVERAFQPRNPLRGKGRRACVPLFEAKFIKGIAVEVMAPDPIDFSDFDSRTMIEDEKESGYFDVSNGLWEASTVRPLNAIWFVILHGVNTPVKRLGDGYRLWHRLNQAGDPGGYDWQISQSNENARRYRVEIRMSGKLNMKEDLLVECPRETVSVSFEFEWVLPV